MRGIFKKFWMLLKRLAYIVSCTFIRKKILDQQGSVPEYNLKEVESDEIEFYKSETTDSKQNTKTKRVDHSISEGITRSIICRRSHNRRQLLGDNSMCSASTNQSIADQVSANDKKGESK